MSKEQHQSDRENDVPHYPDGGCLNRHVGCTPAKASGQKQFCAHRYQAYARMKETAKDLYNWPRYDSLVQAAKDVPTASMPSKSGKMFPWWYKTVLEPPKKGDWDVTGENFFVHAAKPYWHEAHHIVPNSTLAEGIASVGKGAFTILIRSGLSKENYNLNDKKNMVMLPMDKAVADAIRLPRHRQIATARSHKGYSRHVLGRLKDILNGLGTQYANHEEPDYESVKQQIEDLSEELFGQITQSVAASLDDMVQPPAS